MFTAVVLLSLRVEHHVRRAAVVVSQWRALYVLLLSLIMTTTATTTTTTTIIIIIIIMIMMMMMMMTITTTATTTTTIIIIIIIAFKGAIRVFLQSPHCATPYTCSVSTDSKQCIWGDVWCNGLRVCFPSKRLPQMLECGFESLLGLEFSGFSMGHFLKLVVGGFLRVLRFPPRFHRLIFSKNEMKLT